MIGDSEIKNYSHFQIRPKRPTTPESSWFKEPCMFFCDEYPSGQIVGKRVKFLKVSENTRVRLYIRGR